MIKRTDIMVGALCTYMCTLAAADSARIHDIAHGLEAVRLAAQTKADEQLEIFKRNITNTEQEIVDTENALTTNNEVCTQLQKDFDGAIIRLQQEFNESAAPHRQEELRLKKTLAELRKKLAQQQQEKTLFENQAAQMIAEFVVVDEGLSSLSKRRQTRQASINGAPETTPKQYRKGEFVPSELWDVLPDSFKPYFGTEENT